MRRYVPLLIAGAALIVTACRDAVAPTRSETPAVTQLRSLGNPAFATAFVTGEDASARSTSFTLRPEGGRVSAGDFAVYYPANAVCDPSSSGYGPDSWDRPCATLREPITITARSYVKDGRAHVQFSPDIRFAPGATVIMAVQRDELIGKQLDRRTLDRLTLYYAVVVAGTRYYYDESHADSSMGMHFDSRSGTLFRRIKHFSWYNVRTGQECDPSAGDPDCQQGSPGGGFQ